MTQLITELKIRVFLALLRELSPKKESFQARIQHLKEVSQVDEIAVFPFVSNSDVFDLSHVSLSELRCQHPRYASDFMLLLIDQ